MKYKFAKNLLAELIYAVIGFVFSIRLEALNTVLIEKGLDKKPLEMLLYDEGSPVKYFTGTIILAFIGILLIVHQVRKLRYTSCDFSETVFSVIAICLVAATFITVWVLILNPIVKAIISLGAIVGIIATANP